MATFVSAVVCLSKCLIQSKAYLILCSHTGTGFDDPRVGKTTLDVSTGQVVGALNEQGWGYVEPCTTDAGKRGRQFSSEAFLNSHWIAAVHAAHGASANDVRESGDDQHLGSHNHTQGNTGGPLKPSAVEA
jgi:hypothetical protein